MELTLTSPPGRREGPSWVYQSWQRWVILFWHSSKTENYIWIYMDWWWTAKSIEIWYIYIYITVYILYITIYKWLNWAGWLILIPPHFPHSYLLSIVCPSDVQWWDGLKPGEHLVKCPEIGYLNMSFMLTWAIGHILYSIHLFFA